MPTTTLVFDVNDRNARQGFDRLQRELNETQRATNRTNRTFRDTDGRLRDVRGRFVTAGRGADIFTRSLGGARGLLVGLGAAVAAREIIEFGAASVRAAGQMEGLRRALEAIEGENATQRLRDFNEIAKLPGLNTPQIIRYSNSLRAAGATASEVDAIITTFGQSIVGLGGNANDTSRAMLQLTQAFGENKISQENFSTIKELIPSFNRLAQEVYNTDGSMDALNQRFKASGQTLGQFLLPILARLREEIPAAPVDSYARSIDALGEEFQQFKIAIGTELIPVVSATARELAELFDTITRGTQRVTDFFDLVDEEHQALLNATESAREFAIQLADINTAAGQQEAVSARIQTLYRLRAALRTEQVELDQSSQKYLDYAKRILAVNNELDTLRAIQGTAERDNRAQLIAVRTEELQRANADIERYTQLLERIRAHAVARSDAPPAIQQLVNSLERSRETAASLERQIELLTDGFKDLTPPVETATADLTNYGLALEQLKASAEDAQETLRRTPIFSETLTPNFQAAIDASNAYYNERIRQDEAALAAKTHGTEEFNTIETRIFELRRQRIQAEQALEETRTRVFTERVRARQQAEAAALSGQSTAYREYRQILNEVIELQQARTFRTYIDNLRQQGLNFQQIVPHAREYLEFLRQIAAIPAAASPDAQYGRLRSEIEATTESGNALLSVLRQIVQVTLPPLDLETRIPEPVNREIQIDERIAAEARGQQTLNDIRQDAREQGRQFLNNIISDEERAVQASLRKQARSYRQFANLVSNTFVDLTTGRAENFEQVATAFIQQSLRIVLRAYVEFQIQKRLDDTLTASKIANIQKVNTAQQAGGLAGNLPGLANLPGIGNLGGFLSGGAGALGVAGLLFPNESSNLLSGIKNEISGFLSNVADVPDRAFGAQQIFLKIGDNEAREISDLQDELREEERV